MLAMKLCCPACKKFTDAQRSCPHCGENLVELIKRMSIFKELLTFEELLTDKDRELLSSLRISATNEQSTS